MKQKARPTPTILKISGENEDISCLLRRLMVSENEIYAHMQAAPAHLRYSGGMAKLSAKLATVASQLTTIMLSGEFVREGVIFGRLVKTSK